LRKRRVAAASRRYWSPRMYRSTPADDAHEGAEWATTKDPSLSDVERQFVENWGALAETFGMHRGLGRVHACIYIANEPPDETSIAASLGVPAEVVHDHLRELIDWGVIQVAPSGTMGTPRYLTEQDPWAFFLQIVGERHFREFLPTLHRMRATLEAARRLHVSERREVVKRDRVVRFHRFVEELSSLIDLFVRMGAKPMALVLKTLAKVAPKA
jgi:DNA-binding transcriptional regulator GbsR (MarR family)